MIYGGLIFKIHPGYLLKAVVRVLGGDMGIAWWQFVATFTCLAATATLVIQWLLIKRLLWPNPCCIPSAFVDDMFKAGFLNDLWVFNLSASEWSNLRSNTRIPSPRYRHAAFVQYERLYIHGGHNSFSGERNGW